MKLKISRDFSLYRARHSIKMELIIKYFMTCVGFDLSRSKKDNSGFLLMKMTKIFDIIRMVNTKALASFSP